MRCERVVVSVNVPMVRVFAAKNRRTTSTSGGDGPTWKLGNPARTGRRRRVRHVVPLRLPRLVCFEVFCGHSTRGHAGAWRSIMGKPAEMRTTSRSPLVVRQFSAWRM